MNWKSSLKSLGPGLLYAGAAVGVSHLVQSTRAGAQFGYELIWVIVLAHAIKYPFFLMGPAYAQHTGKSILSGYQKIGSWALWVFIGLTLASMFAVIAAISVVSAGLAENIFHFDLPIRYWSSLLLAFCLGILIAGHYKALDKVIRWVILLLSVTTVLAFLFSLDVGHTVSNSMPSFDWDNTYHLLFLVAFLGWMPAPMDISIWHSVWQVEKQKSGLKSKGNLDFNIGYFGTAVLAVLFLGLGANAFYGSGTTLQEGGIQFSAQLISMYSSTLGNWAFWIIAIAAFTTMFSTIITCIDAFPRVMAEASYLLQKEKKVSQQQLYLGYLIALAFGAQIIVYFFLDNMKQMVDFATSVSFLTTPLLAALSLYAVRNVASKKPILNRAMMLWSAISLILLIAFAAFYLSIL